MCWDCLMRSSCEDIDQVLRGNGENVLLLRRIYKTTKGVSRVPWGAKFGHCGVHFFPH